MWLKANSTFHTLKTKFIEQARLESHSKNEVKDWFWKYQAAILKYKITKGKNLLNIDKSSVRVGCPVGEKVIVPVEVTDLYASSLETWKSVTIFETIYADGWTPPLLFVICLGIKIIDIKIHDWLAGEETITMSLTGYTNNKVIMDYLDHLIKHTKASHLKLWKVLFLHSYITHKFSDFVVKAYEYHIALYVFLFHLTHAFQSLDVGVFWPWKYYHNRAIQRAVRRFDFEYTITSFFQDLTTIWEQTIKSYMIKNAFFESRM